MVCESYLPASPGLARYERLLAETDRLDSAHRNREDVLDPKEYILLGYTLDPRTGLGVFRDYFLRLVEDLKKKPIGEILAQPDVQERVKRIREQDERFREVTVARSRLDGNVVFTDFRDLSPMPVGNRFIVYTLFPQANVSLRVHWGPSRDQVAAHYCPAQEDDTTYAEGDLAKLDIGVHIDGWVVDTAVTVNVGDHPGPRKLVEAARAALEAAIQTAGPGVAVPRVSAAIESTLRARGARPMKNLCGHHLDRWTVHAPPPIPNTPDGAEDRLAVGAVLAIEPFATPGPGVVVEQGRPEVFLLPPGQEQGDTDPALVAVIAAKPRL